MKKHITAVIIAALTLSLLASCSKNAEIGDGAGVVRDPNASAAAETEAVEFNAVYSRTDGYIEKKIYPYVTVIKNRPEIERYTSENEGQYDFYTTFYDAVTAYDAEFFTENALIVIMLEEGSGSITHEVVGVQYDSETGETVVTIRRNVPEVQTADMAEWHVMVEIPADSPILEHTDRIKVEME